MPVETQKSEITATSLKYLILGYGNPGRCDDGLGPALAGTLEKFKSAHVAVESNYQLQVEDAALIAEHDVVIFADAAIDGAEPFSFTEIIPEQNIDLGFTSHSSSPVMLMTLAHSMFGAVTKGYVLGIRGYRFDKFGEELSDKARNNLVAAINFIQDILTGNCEINPFCGIEYPAD